MKWWQSAVFYQIYPRSFADGNGDGIGDFIGMAQKLDYLKDLGVDGIWLSPHFPSPQFDCGYDVSDYTGVAPEYGTLDDFKAFLDAAHARGIRVILDLVLNHTSHLHPWFIESSSSRDNPKRDWYIWRDGKNGGPPNNWCSCFDGDAWEYDPKTDQYYYHYFLKQQPDLNWRNPQVKEAMWDAVRFWLRMGVDGFRLDAIGTIYEPEDLPNHTSGYNLAQLRKMEHDLRVHHNHKKMQDVWHKTFELQFGQPGLHELMKELRAVMDEFPGDRMLVGEDDDIAYQGNGHDELHMVFNFPLMRHIPFSPIAVHKNQAERLGQLAKIDGWPCNTLGNHDTGHYITRFDPAEAEAQARVHTAAMLTLRGTPFIYNGDEIGMTHLKLEKVEDIRDVIANWVYDTDVNVYGMSPAEAMEHAAATTRDKGRTPMQWANAPQGGFCPAKVKPWLPVNPNYAQGINVADQDKDPASLLNFHRQMTALRRSIPALVEGEQIPVKPRSRDTLAFIRKSKNQTVLVLLHLKNTTRSYPWKAALDGKHAQGKLLYSYSGQELNQATLTLKPYDVAIIELK